VAKPRQVSGRVFHPSRPDLSLLLVNALNNRFLYRTGYFRMGETGRCRDCADRMDSCHCRVDLSGSWHRWKRQVRKYSTQTESEWTYWPDPSRYWRLFNAICGQLGLLALELSQCEFAVNSQGNYTRSEAP